MDKGLEDFLNQVMGEKDQTRLPQRPTRFGQAAREEFRPSENVEVRPWPSPLEMLDMDLQDLMLQRKPTALRKRKFNRIDDAQMQRRPDLGEFEEDANGNVSDPFPNLEMDMDRIIMESLAKRQMGRGPFDNPDYEEPASDIDLQEIMRHLRSPQS